MTTNTLGLSFANSALHIIHDNGKDGHADILSAETLPYPFDFKFEDLLNSEKLNDIGILVNQFKTKHKIRDAGLAISLPMYFTYTKKIALPIDADEEVITKQVQWELEHYLPGTLADFKVVKSQSTFSFNTYEESLFICINKNIINNLNQMAQAIGANLTKLTADNFSLDGFIRENKIVDEKKNQIFLKLDDLSIISHLFISGKYYISIMDNIYPLKKYTYLEKQLKIAKAQFSNIKNLCDHLPFVSKQDFDLLAYGGSITDSIYKLIEQNFSCNVGKLTTNSYANVAEAESAKFVEAIGTCIS